MKAETINALADAFGWQPIHSKNPHMYSFSKITENGDRFRINVYFNNMTVTVQSDFLGISVYKEVDMKKFEEIVSTHASTL